MSASGTIIDLNHRTWILHSFIGWGRHPNVSLRKNSWLSLCGNLQIIDLTNIGYVPECRHSVTSKCALRNPNRMNKFLPRFGHSGSESELAFSRVWDRSVARFSRSHGPLRLRPFEGLVVKEIDCGNWLAWGYMPAHQYCDLFCSLGWGSDWVYHKLGNAPILRSGTVSWVLGG